MPNPEATLCVHCAKSPNSFQCRWDGMDERKIPEGAEYVSHMSGPVKLYCIRKCPEFKKGRLDIDGSLVQDENLLKLIERFCETLGANYRNALISENRNNANMYAREIRQSYLLCAAGIDAESVIRDIKTQVRAIKKAAVRLVESGDTAGLQKLYARFPESAGCIKAYVQDEPTNEPAPLYEDFSTYCRYFDVNNNNGRGKQKR